MTTTPAPETPEQAKIRQTLTRKGKEIEAEIGGKALPINADEVAIYFVWHLNGVADIGGTYPREQVPALLREAAARIEAAL